MMKVVRIIAIVCGLSFFTPALCTGREEPLLLPYFTGKYATNSATNSANAPALAAYEKSVVVHDSANEDWADSDGLSGNAGVKDSVKPTSFYAKYNSSPYDESSPATSYGTYDTLCNACPQPTCSRCCVRTCCCPRWIVSPEVMYLRRRNSSRQRLITDQTTGATLLSTGDFDDDYQAIPRLQIIRDWSCCNGLEVNLFGLTPWESTNFAGTSASPNYLAPGIPIGSTAPGTVFRTDYETSFSSLEVNFRHVHDDCVTFIAGFRWLELGDELRAREETPISRNLFSVDTNNHMYGFQIGLDAILWKASDRFWIDSGLRAGVFANQADQNTLAPIFSASPVLLDELSARNQHTAFFGELGIDGVYQVCDSVAFRAGYQLMWLEGVALATDQIAANDLIAPGIAAVDTSGSLFLSGATIGVTISF